MYPGSNGLQIFIAYFTIYPYVEGEHGFQEICIFKDYKYSNND